MTAFTATIVIPTFNRTELLRKALRSVRALAPAPGVAAEALVVDNGSAEGTQAVVEEFSGSPGIGVRGVVEPLRGLNHARNRGLIESGSDWVVFLDDDMEAEPGWLGGLAAALDRFRPDIVVGPVEPVFEDEAARSLPGPILASVTSAYSRRGGDLLEVPLDSAHEVPGCNFAVRREAALAAGGFHPVLDRSGTGMLAGGDWEFGRRLARRGGRVVYSPGCAIRHWVSAGKTSRPGLERRWEGLGATAGVLDALAGSYPPPSRLLHLRLRMHRLRLRSLALGVVGRGPESLEALLHARRIRGYLSGAPADLRPVEGPLVGDRRREGSDTTAAGGAA